MISVLIADNQTLTRQGLLTVLSTANGVRIVGQATTSAELQQMIATFRPDVLLLDAYYDANFTVDSLKAIQKNCDFKNVLILFNRQPRHEILEVIHQGIKNFVSKESSTEEIIRAVRATANGEKFYCQKTVELLFGDQLHPAETEETPTLSTREAEIIHLITEGKTNKEIAEKLFLSIHTIKTHRKNIIRKLGFTFKNASELMVITSHLEHTLI